MPPAAARTAEPAPIDFVALATLDTEFLNLSGALSGAGAGSESLLLKRALDLVSEAEQTLADQRDRIAHLELLSTTDELTGLANRRGFVAHFKRQLAAARRHGEAGVLALCDLDGFKQVNDRFGHLAGDRMLCRLADVLTENVRETDVVGRLGGDEFAILLGHCEPTGGLSRIDALAHLANRASIEWDGVTLPIKASFGAAAFAGDDQRDAIIRRADTRLYEAKRERGGRRG